MDLDQVDIAILRELQRDARLQNKELAAKVGVAPSTALERVRSLRRRGILTGFHASVNLAALGRPLSALLSIRARPHRADVLSEYLLEQPETLSLLHLAGPDDYLVRVAVPDTEHLRRLINERLEARPEVLSVNTVLVFESRDRADQAPIT
ncbi:Lrp/AsnC family transcriptional regulator [Actinokineospora sp. G85]|uniref:Lrp/AsnC family transcriptional regulator n=1 Tax=Actinokineospora sp. G85 TaxID=3406626 RepID=UPI003C73E08D